jgi:hypothetical protein
LKKEKNLEYKDCFDFEADLNFEGYLVMVGSAGYEVPEGHFIRSIKTFNPTLKEDVSLYDYEADRDTV